MLPKNNRVQTNKRIKRILVRHKIDIGQLSYMSYKTYINFSGSLVKNDGNELVTQEVVSLIKELTSIEKTLIFLFINWHISPNHISHIELNRPRETA